MFKRLLSRRLVKGEPGAQRFEGLPPTPEEDLAIIGDIHGELGCLNAMIDRLHEVAPTARWVFVGDFIDRGDHSAGVLARLRVLEKDRPNTVFILGNHEDMMLAFLRQPEEAGNLWMRHGGLQTMASFGAFRLHTQNTPEVLGEARERLLETFPEGLEQWLLDRPRIFQSGNVVVVHAGADPAKPMSDQNEQAFTWGHMNFSGKARQDGLWVVHGHSIVDAPQERNGVISIDTGAYATGRLTAAIIRNRGVEFLQTTKP